MFNCLVFQKTYHLNAASMLFGIPDQFLIGFGYLKLHKKDNCFIINQILFRTHFNTYLELTGGSDLLSNLQY